MREISFLNCWLCYVFVSYHLPTLLQIQYYGLLMIHLQTFSYILFELLLQSSFPSMRRYEEEVSQKCHLGSVTQNSFHQEVKFSARLPWIWEEKEGGRQVSKQENCTRKDKNFIMKVRKEHAFCIVFCKVWTSLSFLTENRSSTARHLIRFICSCYNLC